MAGTFLAEHYFPAPDDLSLDDLGRRLAAACKPEVRFLGSAGLPGDDCVLSLFAGPSAEAVAAAFERAQVTVDRIVPVVWQPQPGADSSS